MIESLPSEGASKNPNPELQKILEARGYAVSDPHRDYPLGACYTRPTELDNYIELVTMVPDRNLTLVSSWAEELKSGKRAWFSQGFFDPDGYPKGRDGRKVAEDMGLVEPLPAGVHRRLELTYAEAMRETEKAIPSAKNARRNFSLGSNFYLGWKGWFDNFQSSGISGEELRLWTGRDSYDSLYTIIFDLEFGRGGIVHTLFKEGLTPLPGGRGGILCRFRPRTAFPVEGQLVQKGETQGFSWAVLATAS